MESLGISAVLLGRKRRKKMRDDRHTYRRRESQNSKRCGCSSSISKEKSDSVRKKSDASVTREREKESGSIRT